MRILYLHQYFKTPDDGEAMRSFHIATAMVKAGHEVVMVTSHNKKRFEQKSINGIQVFYLPISYANEFGFKKRIRAFIKYQKQAVKLARKLGRFDVCYATSTPLTVGLSAVKLKKKSNLPFIFEIRDLWPDAPIELGAINNRYLIGVLRKMEKSIYDQASKIVVLNPKVQKIIKERTSTPTAFLPNMADVDFYDLNKANNPSPVFLYAGTLGEANDVVQVLSFAKCIPEGKFLIAGEGKKLNALKVKLQEMELKNVTFLGKLDKDALKRVYAAVDFSLVTFKDNKVLELNSPNKFFEALANGVIPVVSLGGWLQKIVEEHACGIHYSPDTIDLAANKITTLFDDKEALQNTKNNARQLAEEQFSVQMITKGVLAIMDEI